VALARAIVRHPRAFLMDEPLSNLDAKLRLQMRGELKHLQQQLKTTTVYVTHDQAEAMTLGHRVAVMNKGVLQQFAAPLEIYHRPANRFVAEFVGNPGMNFIDGELRGREFVSGSATLALPDDKTPINGPRNLTMGIRPEHIRVAATARDGWTQATVYVTELMGSEVLVVLESGDKQIVARAPGNFRADTGSTVWIEFDAQQVHFFDSEDGVRIGF
jgi:multiple sugar transport system ATP-binding protein